MLTINNVSVSYDNKQIIKNLSCHFNKGEITAIIGPNGCGKSTLLKAISKSKRVDNGSISIKDQNIMSIKHKEFAKTMSILPQGPSAPFDLTVRQLVTMGRSPHLNWRGKLAKKDLQVIDDVLKKTKLEGLQHKSLHQMSGGEKQRAWLAMTLAQEPELLLLDEPTTFLDVNYQYETLELINNLRKIYKITVIMVLHDINQAVRYSDNLIAMKKGMIVAQGLPEQIVKPNLIKEVFNLNSRVIYDDINNKPIVIPI